MDDGEVHGEVKTVKMKMRDKEERNSREGAILTTKYKNFRGVIESTPGASNSIFTQNYLKDEAN